MGAVRVEALSQNVSLEMRRMGSFFQENSAAIWEKNADRMLALSSVQVARSPVAALKGYESIVRYAEGFSDMPELSTRKNANRRMTA